MLPWSPTEYIFEYPMCSYGLNPRRVTGTGDGQFPEGPPPKPLTNLKPPREVGRAACNAQHATNRRATGNVPHATDSRRSRSLRSEGVGRCTRQYAANTPQQ